jgi:hypothetical protein
MRLAFAIPIVLVPMIVSLALTHWLAKYRVDLRPWESPYEGASWVWQVNVFRRSNYNEQGQKLLPWLYLCTAVSFCTLVAAVFLVDL